MHLFLNEKLMDMGIRVHGRIAEPKKTKHFFDIERTIIEALMEFPKDTRVLSLILSWIHIHGKYVIIEKLMKLKNDKNKIYLSMIAAYATHIGLHKWKTLAKKQKETLYLYPKKIVKSAVKIKTAIPWLKKINILAPMDSIRIRKADILKPTELIKRNHQYRNRYLYGTSWRADIITAIQLGCETPTEIVRLIGCSYEPAHRIFNEYRLAVGI